jgi:dethiobiotin synthetase
LRGLFVTGTDTAAGKTVLSACLLAAMHADGERARACKPVLTGLDTPQGGSGEPPPVGWPADDELLAAVTGVERHEVSPLRFGAPASPHLAAELVGETIDPRDLLSRTRAAVAGASLAVVEGVGGLLVPLSEGYLVRDLAVELGLPLLVAARPGLGTINHTLLTIEAARASGLEIRAVVLTPWPSEPGAIERSNRETIARLGAVEVATLEALGGSGAQELARAGATLPWRQWVAQAPAGQSGD